MKFALEVSEAGRKGGIQRLGHGTRFRRLARAHKLTEPSSQNLVLEDYTAGNKADGGEGAVP